MAIEKALMSEGVTQGLALVLFDYCKYGAAEEYNDDGWRGNGACGVVG